MSEGHAFRCDGCGVTTSPDSRYDAVLMRGQSLPPSGWLLVAESFGDLRTAERSDVSHYCGWPCILKHGGQK